ncbi:hypothetical protein [Rivihabitans pingtungensis]|uniref:hypothetical protein n=1 Tax=Rivihabitans pingtungensis TaxID=1054498 RepID=UPI002352DB48|nr:hypothetical protein [Rivihabitans pingtungensis]MCK6435994.1 hypothetical protein [Rivihabitans pingtungensis]
MNNHASTIAIAIKELADSKPPSKAAVIEQLMPVLDAAIARHVTLEELAAQLTAGGVPVTAGYLANARCRIKKKGGAHARRKTQTAAAPPTGAAAPPQPANGVDWKKHRDSTPKW